MRDKYLPPKCTYTVDCGRIVTDGTFKGKITGTSLGGILNESPWSSPFQAACAILGLASKDISQKPAVKAGIALEGEVINYLNKTFDDIGEFIPAEDVFEKREGDHDSWPSDFEDDIFGGHVDGLVKTPEGEVYILEIKTTSNLDAWSEGVPLQYYWQVALYDYYLAWQDKVYVGLGIMDPEALRDPTTWVPSKDSVALMPLDLDRDVVEGGLDQAREWYHEFIDNFTTPEYDPTNPRDVELYEYLVNLTNEEFVIQNMIDDLMEIRAELKTEEEKLQPLKDKEEMLKTSIKEYMEAHSLDDLDSVTGSCYAVMTSTTRTKINTTKMVNDGLDPDKYLDKTISKSFTIKERKE